MRNKVGWWLFGLSLLFSLGSYFWIAHRPGAEAAETAAEATATRPETSDGARGSQDGELEAPEADESAALERVAQEVRQENAVHELAGRVTWPLGTPDDESAEVLLLGKAAFDDEALRDANDDQLADDARILGRCKVEADGSFRLPWRDLADGTWLHLRGRYVFLASPRKLKVTDTEQPLELAPELGAWVTGQIAVAAGVDATGFDVRTCELELMFDALALAGGMRPPPGLRAPKVRPRSDGSFEFRGVASRLARDLRVRCERLAAFKGQPVEVRPGLHITLDAVLTRGGELAGRIVDSDGAPVAGAKLAASVDPLVFGQGGYEVRSGTSDAEGRFLLSAVLAGEVDLRLEGRGVLERTLACSVRDGERSELGDVVLKRGATLTGVVRWPDGRPAAGAKVRADFDPAALGGMSAFNAMQGARGEASADADGRFTIDGLGKGPFLVSASAAPAPEELEHRVSEGGVAPGGRSLELVLAPPLALALRVVDASGTGLAKVTVRARENVGGVVRGLGGRTAIAREDGEAGRYSFEGLGPGKWDLVATADGFTRSELALELPREDVGEIVLVLQRGGSVSGTVVDLGGAPVAGATVQVAANLQNIVSQAEESGLQTMVGTTLADGSFRLANLPAGQHKLVARADGTAGSDAVEVEVQSAAETTGIVLALRVGGTLTGEVYAQGGVPAAGAQVLVQLASDPLAQRFVFSDREGRFRIEHLAAGSYNVMHFPSAGAKSRNGSASEEPDPMAMVAGMLLASATVAEGETAHVVLGSPAKNAVELAGRVTCDGRGVGGIVITLMPDGDAREGAAQGALKFATTDEDGRFTATLDGPGAHLASLQKPGTAGQQQTLTQRFVAPEVARFQHEFELPVGAIAGRVRASDGAPAARVRVTLAVDGPVQVGTLFGDNYAEVETDADGRYELIWLAEGRYTVAIGGAPLGGLLGGSARGGRQLREGVAVRKGQRTEGIDFELHAAGRVSGLVKGPDGAPAAEAALFLRDAAGRPLERLSMIATDSAGRFHYDGLEPGEYTVFARKIGLASDARARVLVREGETAEVELALGAATLLLVTVTNEDGSAVEASLSVLDDAGREVHGLASLAEVMTALSAGELSSREQRVGPLPPGKYRVIVTAADGRKESKPVTLSGQSERKLNVRL